MEVRSYTAKDATALFDVIKRAILEGTAAHYDGAQRQAWADRFASADALDRKLASQDTVVGLIDGRPQGVMSRQGGHLDLAYVAPEVMGSGLADILLAVTVGRARAEGHGNLTVEASHPARRFFARKGWHHDAAQTVTLGPVALENHRMVLAT